MAAIVSLSSHRRPFPSRRPWLAAILIVGMLTGTTLGRVSGKRPNVLLITVDTLRADHLSCYGYPLPTTPRIDELARGGTLFEDAQCQVPKTNPSLASLFTGLDPENHKDLTLRLTLPSAYPLLAEQLRAAGYRTGAVVGQYNLTRQSGFARGFDDYFDSFPVLPEGSFQAGRFLPSTEKRAEELTSRSLGWLKSVGSRRPFFLWVHYVDPHAPYDPPPPFDHSFPVEHYPTTILDREQIHDQAFDPPHFELSYYQQRYDGAIRYVDTQIGRLLDGLRDMGLRDATLVILTADHGEFMGDTDGPTAASSGSAPYFSHGMTLTNGETHVPLLWKMPEGWASQRPPARIPGPVEIVDVLPTLLDLLDLSPLRGDGRSQAAAVRTGRDVASKPAQAFSCSIESNSASLQTSQWKLIYYPGASLQAFFTGHETFRTIAEGPGRMQLFDRSEGRDGHDVAGAHPDLVEQLRSELLERFALAQGPRDSVHHPVCIPWDDTEHLKRLRALGYI